MNAELKQELVDVAGGHVEVTCWGALDRPGQAVICASHPIDAFGQETAALLANASGASVVCVNPRAIGNSSGIQGQSYELVQMIDDFEAVRRHLGLKSWVFWGMSGGGWLGQLYAERYAHSLNGLILESACACLRARVLDPECVLSPRFPAWREALAANGLLDTTADAGPCSREELEWAAGPGTGATLRRIAGAAVLVSPVSPSATMQRMLPMLLELDMRDELQSIDVPALVIAGTTDPVLPIKHARALHDALPNSEFFAVDGAGHVPVTELRPEVSAAVRAFLRKQVLGA